ncbi:MAG: hypothetical protein KDB80_02690, partial [Planctomycetes bacterium]|nr:hypothetical protein [Planctomycetota bacterium]
MSSHIRATARSTRSVRDEGGWSFVELIAAVAIVGVALLVMLQQMSISYRETGISHDSVFAYQKAIAMMAEIQSGVESGALGDSNLLEALDDHDVDNPVLTTLLDSGSPVDPGHTMSGNLERDGDWIWWRSIEVRAVPSSELMRYVRIRVRAQLRSGIRVTAASIGSVIHLPVQATPPKQVYDVYALALATAPSTAMTIEDARTAMNSAISRIESANRGLEYRVHWITEFGYGRDQRYCPLTNVKFAADAAAPFAYWYPNKTASGDRLFTPDFFSGHYRDDFGNQVNGYHATDNPLPHAIADRFNHCTRAPIAGRMHAARVALGTESLSEPPLQVLLEDMAVSPGKYRNALFVNLHGEALPCPPIRNYSDAAKDPLGHPGVRVVTHPERLWTPRDPDGDGDHSDSLDATFRVYGYKTDVSSGASVLAVPITLQIFGVDLTGNVNGAVGTSPTTLQLDCLAGGVDRGGALAGDLGYYPFTSAKGVGDSPAPTEMYYEVGYVATPVPYTWVKLHNTPLVTPRVGMRGLDDTARLYGMDYVPSPITDTGTFDVDLATNDTTARPRNTARWRVT